ncbi:MAG: 30S ribosomal protein S20 [Candidatus Taylorbacteria bacterium RIFCSPHIGHO2_01_FULL_46_22b]|uniref:Small ribosomal subunit protein bS20 n=1 Tax=Candidatus Taylorbacteria bacterium RIFCSPHIGHO2_01_FULL_46_22b TaxID=1802301 RepID=A0A1G2M4J9_9BACT|nr:MAG: 30S ribosomal protein S20 [Candidatus Taylorbacteria bacterium RIFCSPHIGHO2_01_FULL_46_22b]
MAITSSAKKAIRVAEHRQVFNVHRKQMILSLERQVRKALTAGDVSGAKALLPKMYQAIDKAAKTKFIKKNTAARMKSRVAARVNKGTKK